MDKKPETMEEIYDKNFPIGEWKKSTYSFTAEELRRLMTVDAIIQMGKMAEDIANGIINRYAIPRVGIKNTEGIKLLYDTNMGKFFIYEPRVLCDMCGRKKAEFQFNGQKFCGTCLVIAQSAVKPEEKKEVK